MACDPQQIGFQYKRVMLNRHEIRIIILHPGLFNEDIVCDVSHVSFEDSPIYEALSYTWGERTDKVPISLGGAPTLITQNLALALRHLRLVDDVRYLWVDAICINQCDTIERNNQVQQMARIYQMAKHVHLWLGPENETSVMAMAFLKEINERVLACMDSQTQLENVHKWIKCVYEDPEFESIWKSIARLWERGYWSRVWIIQEVVFGTSNRLQCFVHCGKDCVTFETLVALNCAMSLIDRKCYDNEHSDIDIVQLSKSARLDLSWFIVTHGCHARNRQLPLSYLLVRQGRYKATDPRDKVYALLSMVHESQADGLIVDYGLTTVEVYTMAMREMVLREKRLGVLCACCRECRNRDPLEQLPSWCPDFGTDPMDKCCPARLWSYTKPVYYSSGDLDAKARFPAHDGMPVLSARGWCLDMISVRSHGIEYGKGGFLNLECLLFLAQGVEGKTPTCLEDISEAEHEAIWRTLVANRGHSHDKAPETFGHMYRTLVGRYIALPTYRAHVDKNSNLNFSEPGYSTEPFFDIPSGPPLSKPQEVDVNGSALTSSNRQSKQEAENIENIKTKTDYTSQIGSETKELISDQATITYRQKMDACLRKRHLCKSNRRSLPGLVPNTAQDGDIICILVGCALPIILRRMENHYVVIGESYIHGFMYGEILPLVAEERLEQEEFALR